MNILSIVTAVLLAASELAPIGAGIAIFTSVGAGLSMGIATGKACEAIARQPEAVGKIRTILFIGLAFAETTAIYGLLVAIMLILF